MLTPKNSFSVRPGIFRCQMRTIPERKARRREPRIGWNGFPIFGTLEKRKKSRNMIDVPIFGK
jgi:hypothetical protein